MSESRLVDDDVSGEFTDPYTTDGYESASFSTSRASEISVADADFDKHARLVTLYVQIVLGVIGGLLVCAWLWANRYVSSGNKFRIKI